MEKGIIMKKIIFILMLILVCCVCFGVEKSVKKIEIPLPTYDSKISMEYPVFISDKPIYVFANKKIQNYVNAFSKINSKEEGLLPSQTKFNIVRADDKILSVVEETIIDPEKKMKGSVSGIRAVDAWTVAMVKGQPKKLALSDICTDKDRLVNDIYFILQNDMDEEFSISSLYNPVFLNRFAIGNGKIYFYTEPYMFTKNCVKVVLPIKDYIKLPL